MFAYLGFKFVRQFTINGASVVSSTKNINGQDMVLSGLVLFLLFSFPSESFAGNAQPVAGEQQERSPMSDESESKVAKLPLALAKMGAFRCIERADQLSKFLSRGQGDILIVDRDESANTNAKMITATLITPVDDNLYSTVSIVLAPTHNGCSASYSSVLTVPQACDKAEKQHFPSLSFNPIGKTPYRVAVIGANARVLSNNVVSGCVLTKHELIN